ncbi:MAG TPA: cytochrome c [Thermoanaerobaculia bacterium]|nr:cytochrome c [Thermoanaerobaculia bacterium]
MRMNRSLILVGGLLVAATGVVASAAAARQPDEQAGAVRRGEVLYQVHCQTCHGKRAAGDGPLAEHLRVAPADLRRLSHRLGGYSEAWLVRVIDGREEVGAHGSREMPVWGIGFREPGRPGDQEADVRARIQDLVEYLVSIQQAP